MRFTLGGLFFGLTLFATAFGLVGSQRQAGIFQTDRELDLAIVGRGHFFLLDPATNNYRFTRRGHFHLNANGAIALSDGAQEFLLDPPITVPSTATRLVVEPEGNLFMIERGNTNRMVQLGAIQFARFTPDSVPLPPTTLFGPDTPAPPLSVRPGFDGTGLLQQGWLEEPDDWLHRLLRGPALAVLGGTLLFAALGWIGYELWQLRAMLARCAATVAGPH